MSLNEQQKSFQALDNWFCSPQGVNVGHAFADQIAGLNDILHGEILLQLGRCGENSWLPSLRYQHKWLATPVINNTANTLITSLCSLPIDRNSIDCIIAPLTLEALACQKNPIDEIDRVLKPMGYVIFYGINSISLWSAWMRLGKLGCFDGPGKPASLFSIKRSMLHRGFFQCKLSTFYYIPPNIREKWLPKLEILNEIGKMIWPCPAGFYCLVVQKYQEHGPDLVIETISKDELSNSYNNPVPI